MLLKNKYNFINFIKNLFVITNFNLFYFLFPPNSTFYYFERALKHSIGAKS